MAGDNELEEQVNEIIEWLTPWRKHHEHRLKMFVQILLLALEEVEGIQCSDDLAEIFKRRGIDQVLFCYREGIIPDLEDLFDRSA